MLKYEALSLAIGRMAQGGSVDPLVAASPSAPPAVEGPNPFADGGWGPAEGRTTDTTATALPGDSPLLQQ